MATKTYVLALFSLCTLFLVFFFFESTKMEKYSGSSTRLGGYLEEEYGWNDPQTCFRPHHIVGSGGLEEYSKPVDFVVIGDSFSYLQKSWIYYLMQKKDMSFLFMHIDRVAVTELLEHDLFRQNPPKYLLIESMEGLAFLRFRRIANELRHFSPKIAVVDEESLAPKSSQTRYDTYECRRTTSLDFHERMAVTGNYLIKRLRRAILGDWAMSAISLSISCDHCFSNNRKGTFLSQTSDFDKISYKLNYREDAIDGLRRMKKAIESNGYTHFYSTIFPNKVNAYLAFTEVESNPSVFNKPLPEKEISFINLMPDIKKAISSGTRDVYLPNDHHMGSAGFQIVAETIAAKMFSAN